MADVIQCPTCSKKFKLPEKPPAIFTCTGCGTAMDLSGFASAAAEGPAAAAAASEAGASAEPTRERAGRSARASATKTSSRGSSRSGAGSRSRRGRGGDDEDDGEGRGRLGAPKKGNPALVWGSIGGIVVMIVVVIFMLNKKGAEKMPKPDEAAQAPYDASKPPDAGQAPAMAGGPAMGTTPAAGAGMGEAPSMGAGDTPPAEPPPDKPHVSASKVVFHEVGHHPDATPDEQKTIDALVQTAVFVNAGADSKAAERELVKIGIKASPRLVNVFNTVHATVGFENMNGAMECGIADRVLRGIDGWYDRRSKRTPPRLLNARSEAKTIDAIARAWFMWWENDDWKTPVKPWDEATEGNRGEKATPDDDSGGMAGPPAMGGDEK